MAESNQIYDDMRKESYKTLLNSEIQASVAKQNALKYTQNQLNQTGYGTQGLAQSTNLGITNNYRNAMVNAQNTYEQQMAKINKDEYDANQTAWANNGDDLATFLSKTIDEDGNITDMDYYKKALTSYGAVFDDKGNLDLTNAKLDERNKLYYQTMYDSQRDSAEETNNENDKNKVIVDNETIFKTSSGDSISFYQGNKTNKNFYLRDESGNTMEWELGSVYTSYPNRINNGAVSMEANQHAVGDIWLSENDKYLSLVIKDQKGVVRMVEATNNNKYDGDKIADLFNRYTDLDLQSVKPLDDTRGFELKDKNGNRYRYVIQTDGSIALKKKKK